MPHWLSIANSDSTNEIKKYNNKITKIIINKVTNLDRVLDFC
jgi:hypothetical protein